MTTNPTPEHDALVDELLTAHQGLGSPRYTWVAEERGNYLVLQLPAGYYRIWLDRTDIEHMARMRQIVDCEMARAEKAARAINLRFWQTDRE